MTSGQIGPTQSMTQTRPEKCTRSKFQTRTRPNKLRARTGYRAGPGRVMNTPDINPCSKTFLHSLMPLKVKEGFEPREAFKKSPPRKYLAFKILETKECWFRAIFEPYFASIDRLKVCKSLKPYLHNFSASKAYLKLSNGFFLS